MWSGFYNLDAKPWLDTNVTSLHKERPAKKVEKQLKEIE